MLVTPFRLPPRVVRRPAVLATRRGCEAALGAVRAGCVRTGVGARLGDVMDRIQGIPDARPGWRRQDHEI